MTALSDPARVTVADVPVHALDLPGVLAHVDGFIRTRAPHYNIAINAAKVVCYQDDAAMRDATLSVTSESINALRRSGARYLRNMTSLQCGCGSRRGSCVGRRASPVVGYFFLVAAFFGFSAASTVW